MKIKLNTPVILTIWMIVGAAIFTLAGLGSVAFCFGGPGDGKDGIGGILVQVLMSVYIIWWIPFGFIPLPESGPMMTVVFILDGALWFGLIGIIVVLMRKRKTAANRVAPTDP